MSSKARKIVDEVKERRETIKLMSYTTLVGSIISTCCILNGLDEDTMIDMLEEEMGKEEHLDTVEKLCDYFWDKTSGGCNNELKALMVLVTDHNGIRSPQVSFVVDGQIMPLRNDGIAYGVLQMALEGRGDVDVEYIYDEEGNHIE